MRGECAVGVSVCRCVGFVGIAKKAVCNVCSVASISVTEDSAEHVLEEVGAAVKRRAGQTQCDKHKSQVKEAKDEW